MIDDLLQHFIYDEVFISDDLYSYKGNPDSKFFRQVIQRIGTLPSEILHIGDSVSDVVGASRAGINSCWLNRENAHWTHDVKPDYIITSLSELPSLLENELLCK